MHVAFVFGMLRTRVDRNRARHTCVDLCVSSGSGVRCFVFRLCVAERRAFSLSNDIEHAMANEEARGKNE